MMRSLCFAVLLALLATSAVAQPVCILTATVDEARSKVGLGGTASALGQTLSIDPIDTVSIAGSIYIVLPTTAGQCPAPAALAGAVSKAYVANPQGKPGIRTGSLKGNVGSLASLSFDGIQAEVSANIINAATSALTTQFTVTAGQASYSTALGSSNQDLGSNKAQFIGSGCVLAVTGPTVGINCQNLNLNYGYTAKVLGFDVSAALAINGALYATADVTKNGAVSATAPPNANLGAPSGTATSAGRR